MVSAMIYDRETFYSCYSPRVHEHLAQNGFDTFKDINNNFTGQFLNIKTNKWCHVYKYTDELRSCIAEVSNTNK